MPMAVAAIAAAWTAVTAAAATFVTALTFGAGLMAGISAWTTVISVVGLGAALLMKPPGLGSQGQQVNIQMAGPDHPIPLIIGRTGTQGIITYRGTHGSNNDVLLAEHVLSVGPVDAIESFSVMGRALTFSGNPTTGMATVTQVSGVDMRKSKLFRYDGLRVAHRVGSHTDTSTLSSITGDSVPFTNSSDTMPGLARTILRCKLDEKRLNFPNGYPDDPITVVRGVKCYDPRLDSTQTGIGGSGSHRVDNAATHTWSENPFIVALNFALGWWSPLGTKMFGLGMELDMIDVAAFVAAANVADANSWKVGGQVSSLDGDWAIITNIMASGGGVPIDRAGKLSCFVRAPKIATFVLKEADVLGGRKVSTSTAISQRVNRIIPHCRQANQKWEIIAGKAITDESWLTQDGGNVRTEEVTYPLVNSHVQAAQLATYHACESREFLEFEVTCKPRALAVDVGDCIEVDLPEFSEGQNFIVMSRKWDAAQKTVTMLLKAETFEKHAFALGQSPDAPEIPTLVTFDPTNPAGPSEADWAITANSITQVGGEAFAIMPAIVVTGEVRDPNVDKIVLELRYPNPTEADVWPEGTPNDLTEDDIEFALAEHGWTWGQQANRTATQVTINGVEPATTYEASIKYEMLSGAFSERLNLGSVTTAQDQAGSVGPGTVDWEQPDGDGPIINRPPVLVDLTPGGNIQAQFVEIDALSNVTLQDAYTQLNAADEATDAALAALDDEVAGAIQDIDDAFLAITQAGAELDNAVLDIDANIAAVQADVDDVWGIVGTANNTPGSLRARVITLENTTTGDSTVAAQRLTALEAKVDGDPEADPPVIGALSRLTDLETTLSGSGFATVTQVNDLQTLVEGADSVLEGRLTEVETATSDLNSNKVEVSAFSTLSATVDLKARTYVQTTAPNGTLTAGDLWIDSDANNKLHRYSGSAWVAVAATAAKTYASTTEPTTGMLVGDLWFDTNDNNKMYRYSGSAWIAFDDERIAGLSATVSGHTTALSDLESGKATVTSVNTLSSKVDLKNRSFVQTTAPTSPQNGQALVVGDLWMDSDDNNKIHRWNGTSWAVVHDVSGANALAELVAARGASPNLSARIGNVSGTIADALTGKASASDFNTLNTEVIGARGTQTSLNARLNVAESDIAGKASASSVTTLSSRVDTKTRTFSQNSAPTNPSGGYPLVVGDVWYDADDNYEQYRWSGSAWVPTGDLRGEAALAEIITARQGATSLSAKIGTISGTIADSLAGKASASEVTTLSSEVTTARGGQSSLNVRLNNVETDVAGKASASSVSSLSSKVDLHNRTFLQTTAPANPTGGYPLVVGDLWADSDDNNQLYRWNGTSWAGASDLRGEAALAELVAARGAYGSLSARIGNVSGTIADSLAGKASASSFSSLEAEITTARGGQASLNTRLNSVDTAISGKASASSVGTLESRATGLEGRLNTGLFTDGNQYFNDGINGWTVTGNGNVATVGGRPNVFTCPSGQTSDAFGKHKFAFDTSRKYRIKADYWTGAGGVGSQGYIGFRAYNAAGAALTHSPGSYAYVAMLGTVQAPNAGWVTYVSPTIAAQAPGYGFPPGTAYIELLILGNYNSSTTPWGCDHIVLEDITDAVAIDAAEARIQTAEDTLVDLPNNYASAGRATTIEASLTGVSLLQNTSFRAYPTASGLPTNWSDWSQGASGTRVTGPNGGYAYRHGLANGVVGGIFQDTSVGSTNVNQWMVIETSVKLNSGTLQGAGVLLYVFDAASNVVNSASVAFHTHKDSTDAVPGGGVPGRTYTFTSAPIQITSSVASWSRIYQMTHYDGFAVLASGARNLTWIRTNLRPATAAEIAVGKADTGAGLNARITSAETATTDGRFATASALSSLSATVGGHTGTINTLNSVTAGHTGAIATMASLSRVGTAISGWSSTNTGTSTTFDVYANNFRISDGSSAVAPFSVSGGVVYANNLVVRSASSGARTEVKPTGVYVYNASNVAIVELGTLL